MKPHCLQTGYRVPMVAGPSALSAPSLVGAGMGLQSIDSTGSSSQFFSREALLILGEPVAERCVVHEGRSLDLPGGVHSISQRCLPNRSRSASISVTRRSAISLVISSTWSPSLASLSAGATVSLMSWLISTSSVVLAFLVASPGEGLLCLRLRD